MALLMRKKLLLAAASVGIGFLWGALASLALSREGIRYDECV